MSGRDARRLPKAHLHLHFTGSMRHDTLCELADQHGVHLPDALRDQWPPRLHATDERGWFRFQRLYDIARSCIRTPSDVRRLLREAAEDERDDGSGWLEIQVEPTSYAPRLGGLTPTVELILDAAREASEAAGVGIGLIIGANRTRHPLDARTLARLAAQYAGRGIVGFGLANDERRGRAADFEGAFRIAHRAGLLAVPHGGEMTGARSVRECLDILRAHRVGHGVRAVEDPRLVDRIAGDEVVLEICPTSNVSLGVVEKPEDVPLRQLYDAGVRLALGADDPLLFGSRLTAQYELARDVFGLTDRDLAELARHAIHASAAPSGVQAGLLAGVDAWLAPWEG
ncbi:MAG: adenosine deaminase [Streptomycetales bacterium]